MAPPGIDLFTRLLLVSLHLLLKFLMRAPAAQQEIGHEDDTPDDQAVKEDIEIDRGWLVAVLNSIGMFVSMLIYVAHKKLSLSKKRC